MNNIHYYIFKFAIFAFNNIKNKIIEGNVNKKLSFLFKLDSTKKEEKEKQMMTNFVWKNIKCF